jgi:hypothetical protein
MNKQSSKVLLVAGALAIAAMFGGCDNGSTTPTIASTYFTKAIPSRNLTLHIEDRTGQVNDTNLSVFDVLQDFAVTYPSDINIIIENGNVLTRDGDNFTIGINYITDSSKHGKLISYITNAYVVLEKSANDIRLARALDLRLEAHG